MAVVYMPTESTDISHGERYDHILQTLTRDRLHLDSHTIPCFLYGDFNAHIGTAQDDDLGITGNRPKIGNNGQRLLMWLQFHSMPLGNCFPCAQGTWTYQSSDGNSLSAIDFLITRNSDLSRVKHLIIDKDKETNSINTDHNLISVIQANHIKIQWLKPHRPKWAIKEMNSKKYEASLSKQLDQADTKRSNENR